MTQDLVITEDDCGTKNGVTSRPWSKAARSSSPARAYLGRVTVDDLVDPETDETVIVRRHHADEDLVDLIDKLGIDEVKVRTPLTCDTRYGLCAKCYGRDLGRGTWSMPVNRSVSSPPSRSASRVPS